MNRRMRIGLAIAMLGVGLLSSGAALAQGDGGQPRPPEPGMPRPGGPPGAGPHGEWGPPPEGRLGLRLPPPEALDRLGLNEVQRTKIDELLDSERRQAIRGEADARIAELDLQKLIEADSPDAAAVAKAIERLSAVRQEMLRAHVAAIIGLRALLTPEQRGKLRPPPSDSPWH